jgi:hypothetical protein
MTVPVLSSPGDTDMWKGLHKLLEEVLSKCLFLVFSSARHIVSPQ